MLRRSAFSLLEVILSMAVLAGAIAVLGESANVAMKNAQYARDVSHAQLVCESTMAEVLAGLITPDPVQDMPVDTETTDDPNDPGWSYSIDSAAVDVEPGLLQLTVTVTQNMPQQLHPATFSVVRWVADPNYQATTSSTGNQTSGSGTTSLGGVQ